jgi:septum formation protein
MLRALSGKTHVVYSGVSVISPDRTVRTAVDSTEVSFCEIPDAEIRSYVASGEPMDKAGAYGIQGRASLFVRAIEGDYFNVVGLPLCKLGQMLKELGVELI